MPGAPRPAATVHLTIAALYRYSVPKDTTPDTDPNAELLRTFQEATADLGVADMRALMSRIMSRVESLPPVYPPRPELRRPRRDHPAIYRLRIDLDGARPPIWRRLDVRSDLTLDVVHQVIQASFDWYDYHLHRFALGAGPFSPNAQLFLCPFDVEEADPADEGLPATDVHLDETMQQPGDVLRYIYDYGDSWHLTLRLEKVMPAADDSPLAVAIGGKRAAPPEDCGGVTDAEGLTEILDDPAHFDLDEINHQLQAQHFTLTQHGIDPRLVEVVYRLALTTVGDAITARADALQTAAPTPDADTMADALTAHRWFLDRAADSGIALTAAGYLTPADVETACLVVPETRHWRSKHNREVQAFPLLRFRESLQRLGLLRKHKGRLLLTRAGAAAQRDPAQLWNHVAERLIPSKGKPYDLQATLLLLLHVATSPGQALTGRPIAAALTELDWRRTDGRPLSEYDALNLDAWITLSNVISPAHLDNVPRTDARTWVSPAAAALAAAALR